MTSQAQAVAPLEGVRGLVFFAFPLHPAGAPSDRARGASGRCATIPMLFLQGTRDALAELTLLRPVVKSLGPRATLVLAQDADHSFHVPAKTGRKDGKSWPNFSTPRRRGCSRFEGLPPTAEACCPINTGTRSTCTSLR